MKGPPTQEDILKLGKSHSMQNIGNLDLSERNIGRIDSEVFNQLKGLQTLDLSQNCLTSIPSDLHLPSLQTLDLSYNQLDSVDFVRQFDNLQQLYLGDNDAIKIEDYYTAKVLCPSLRGIDGAEDIKHIDKGISLYTDQLQPQIEAVWEARFSEVYSNGVNKEEMESLHEEFVNTINQGNIVGSNLTMVKFRNFMISHLCRKLISDVNQGKVKSKRRSTKSLDGQNTPSHYGTRIAKGVTPVKHYSNTEEPISDTETAVTQKQRSSKKRKREDSPNTSPVKSSPIKRKRESSPVSSPVKSTTQKRKRETTPDSCEEFLPIAKRKKDNTKGTPDFTKLRKSIQGSKLLKGLPDYEPSLFIRCHSNGNNPSDGITKIWNCAFEPLIGSPGETTNILATCGGKNICFTDCQTGKVMKRYKDCSKSESFYALAWTTLEADGKHMKDDVNILAVA
ncbi:leucine-rich repeat and WD repeat-containing protein 1-like, partial [Ruditapes philippinarum]|uniref:leucine-rich repeat and WD repeat-containing protein 1-like n=1 Tax=Ruditapes philippinarum TaxID=129788 RepID=UPI00295BB898